MTGAQVLQLRQLWGTRKWTMQDFTSAVRENIGVEYDPDHMCRILQRLRLKEKRRYSRRIQLDEMGEMGVAPV